MVFWCWLFFLLQSLAMTHRLLSFLVSYIKCTILSSFGKTKGIFCFQWCTCCSRKCMCVFLLSCFDVSFYKLRMFFSLTRTFFMKHFSQNISVDNKLKTIKCLWSLKHQIRIFPQHYSGSPFRPRFGLHPLFLMENVSTKDFPLQYECLITMWLHEFLETTLVLQLLFNHTTNLQITFEIGASWCLWILNHPFNPWISSHELFDTLSGNWTSLNTRTLERTPNTLGGGIWLFTSL